LIVRNIIILERVLNRRGPFSTLRYLSILLILAAIILAVLQLVRFSRVRAFLPAGLVVAGVPVGGLDRSQAAQRLQHFLNLVYVRSWKTSRSATINPPNQRCPSLAQSIFFLVNRGLRWIPAD
jgi:hypothetical protein